MMPNKSPRTIVITGSNRGCGRSLAERFIEGGHTVIGCGRSAESVYEMQKLFPAPHRWAVVDVADDHQVATWAKSILNSGLVPDLLINNAAIMNHTALLWQVPAAEFQRIVDINIVGTVNVIRHFLPAMLTRRRGVVVNFSSGWGRAGAPEVAPYCATKFAIEGLSQSLAQELPGEMASVALNPGIINTDMLQSCWADGANNYPSADLWSVKAAAYLLQLGARDNGQSLNVTA